MQTRTFLKAVTLPLAFGAARAFALDSSRPIRLVVPLPAGSGNDFVARVISAGAARLLGQAFVVENRPGASGVIGTMGVVRAAPDGLTLLCATTSHLATNLALLKDLPYDPRRDLSPIAGATVASQVLVVNAASPIRSLAEFIAYGKTHPGKLSMGYSTSTVQLQIASLGKAAGIEVLTVPYRGAPAALADVLGGLVHATLDGPLTVLPHVKSGKLRALGATTAKRNPLMPDCPAIAETLEGFDFPLWNAFVGPAGMKPELVRRLGAAISQAQREPAVAEKLAAAGSPAFLIEPDALKAYIGSEVLKYARLAKEAGLQPE